MGTAVEGYGGVVLVSCPAQLKCVFNEYHVQGREGGEEGVGDLRYRPGGCHMAGLRGEGGPLQKERTAGLSWGQRTLRGSPVQGPWQYLLLH